MKKFNLGQLVMTRSVNDTMADDEQFAKDVTNALRRYAVCEWGDMCLDDYKANDAAVESGEDRIFAAYITSRGKVWVITEWDRSVTTVLFPSEY